MNRSNESASRNNDHICHPDDCRDIESSPYFDHPGKPVLTACVDCGENAPESGLICNECREAAFND